MKYPPQESQKGAQKGQKMDQKYKLLVGWVICGQKRVKNGRKIHQKWSFGSLSRYEVGPKGAKNGQKNAKNVSVGSFLRSEVGSKKIKSRPKKVQPEKIIPAKKNLNPAKKN